MRDRERTARMVQQLVDTLQQVTSSLKQSCTWLVTCPVEQAVRATPIPVTWMTREEDSLLTGQVSLSEFLCKRAVEYKIFEEREIILVYGRNWRKYEILRE